MSSEEFDRPEYLGKWSAEKLTVKEDNFGPEDQLWTGDDGGLDPVELLDTEGYEKHSALETVIRALILGHTPNAVDEEIQKRVTAALRQIRDIPKSGRPPKDDDEALLEIASEFHKQKSHENGGKVPLRPIVQAVVENHFAHIPKTRNIERLSYIEKLEDKFNNNKDWYLARATMDDDWGRMNRVREMKRALKALADLDIPVEVNAASPKRLFKNRIGSSDETHDN